MYILVNGLVAILGSDRAHFFFPARTEYLALLSAIEEKLPLVGTHSRTAMPGSHVNVKTCCGLLRNYHVLFFFVYSPPPTHSLLIRTLRGKWHPIFWMSELWTAENFYKRSPAGNWLYLERLLDY